MNQNQRLASLVEWLTTTLALAQHPHIDPVGESSEVYRISTPQQVSYLRVAPEQTFSWASEVTVYQILHSYGLHVPDVIAFEPAHPDLQRSLLLLTAIPGISLRDSPLAFQSAPVLIAAGRELALLNQIPLAGFGWMNRQLPGNPATGAFAHHRDYVQQQLEQPLHSLRTSTLLTAADVRAIETLLERSAPQLTIQQGFLVHGDLSPAHIFHHGAQFTGMIDPDLKVSHPLYDLGHVRVLYPDVFVHLVTGYETVRRLTEDDQQQIRLWSVIIATRKLGKKFAQQRLTYEHQQHLCTVIRRNIARE
jgi:aminoglycoside phosphotransferase (APT) family kinase protein